MIQTNHTALLYLTCDNIFQSILFDDMISHLSQLEELFFYNCRIDHLFTSALKGAEALRILSLKQDRDSKRNLTIESGSFNHTPSLEQLDVSGMGITQLPGDVFCGLKNLTHLNVSNNLLQKERDLGYISTSDEQTCLPALSVLDYHGNQLKELNGPLQLHMPNMEVIFLQYNKLHWIGIHTFANLTKLVILDLSHNRLMSLGHEIFTGLFNLAILMLNNNQIQCLSEDIFIGIMYLHQVDLAHNSITSDCIPSLKHLTWLQKFDISNNQLSYIKNTTFSGLYRLIDINLEQNNIGTIEKCALCSSPMLQTLVLGFNSLTTFDLDDVFGSTGTEQLLTLNLTGNRINSEHLKLNFSNMPSISHLTIGDNNLTEIPTDVFQLETLIWLDLHENSLGDITESSFYSFPNLQYLILRGNLISYIPRKVFRTMQHLFAIDLSRNTISTLEYHCFDELPVLIVINLKYNSIQDIDAVFYKLPALQVLLLDYNSITKITSQDMPSTLTTLSLSHNLISTISGYFLKSMPSIKVVDLTFNNLITIRPFMLQSSVNPTMYLAGNYLICNCNMQYLQTINDFPLMYAKVGDLHSILCQTVWKKFQFLTEIEPDDFLCEYTEVCRPQCRCCYSAPTCFCHDICPETCRCMNTLNILFHLVDCTGRNVTDIPSGIALGATHIHLDGNNISEIDKKPFINNNKAEYLSLNCSGIININPGTFAGLNQLKVLYLDDNNIQVLKNGTFEGLMNLEDLYLQHNVITDIEEGTFHGLESLKILHLEENLLETINLAVFEEVSSSLTEIYLSGNNWTCDCAFGPEFQDWLISMFEKLKDKPSCGTLASGVTSNSTKNLVTQVNFNGCVNQSQAVYIDRPSKALVPVITAMVSVFAIILVTISLLYRYRNIIQVWLYSRYGVRISKLKEDEDKDYDAFISYSSKDERYVVRELAPRLEEGDPPFRLCVHYRDWIVGRGIAESVISSVHSSRRTIMLLSKNYIDSEWCNYEFQTAHHQVMKDKTCRLIVILMDDEPPEGLDEELKLYITTHTYIKRSDPWFWGRLKYALPSVKQEEKTERWAAKAKEKEMLQKTRQAMMEFHMLE